MIVIRNCEKVIGSGTYNCPNRRLYGVVHTDGTNVATVTIYDGSQILFEWASIVPTAFGVLAVDSGVVTYSVSGTNAFLLLYEAFV